MLASDEELFARVWGRVTAHRAEGESEENMTVPAPQTALVPAMIPPPPATQPVPVPPAADTAAALQQWVLHLLTDAEAYRVLARRGGQNRSVLAELSREKQHSAKMLATEYFLRSGVRYWPKNTLQVLQAQPFWPTLRGLYLSERRQEETLRAQAAQEEPELANRYLFLAEQARSTASRLRELLESLF